MDQIAYESVSMPHSNFPVKIFRVESDSRRMGCRFHWHEVLEFYYVLSGGIELICSGIKSWIHEGDIAFANWCEPHKSEKFLDHTLHYIIQVDVSMLYGKSGDICEKKYLPRLLYDGKAFPVFIRNNSLLGSYFKCIIDEYEKSTYGYELVVKAQIYNILAQLFRTSEMKHDIIRVEQGDQLALEYVKKILAMIHENYNSELQLKAIAGQLAISVPHMCRLFKKRTGVTITYYLNQLRCYQAVSLIMNGHQVTKSGLAVGFNDYNYFSRVFRRIMGISPSEYVKKAEGIKNA